jgi:hypothetical protein
MGMALPARSGAEPGRGELDCGAGKLGGRNIPEEIAVTRANNVLGNYT